MAGARKFHKKRVLDIDMSKVKGDIPLSAVAPGALVIFDDCLEMDNSDPRKRTLYALLNALVTRGRHRKGKKGNAVRRF